MKYNFDEIIARRGTNSYKWDSADDADVLPLWVADMDFRTAPAITEVLGKRVAHGIFGYTRVPDEYYDAVTGWFSRRHGWTFPRGWIIYFGRSTCHLGHTKSDYNAWRQGYGAGAGV